MSRFRVGEGLTGGEPPVIVAGRVQVPVFGTADEVVEFAVRNEVVAARQYRALAARDGLASSVRDLFLRFALEEDGHRKALSALAGGDLSFLQRSPLVRRASGPSDRASPPEPDDPLDFEAALRVALRNEKLAWLLYSRMAAAAPAGPTRDVLGQLASEEARHELRFEVLYEDYWRGGRR